MTLAISAYRQAGDQITDADVDKNANIKIAKLGTRTLYLILPVSGFNLSGAGVALTNVGDYAVVGLPDANTGNMYISFPLPDEYDSGNITVRIVWTSSATSGNVRFDVEVKSATTGATTTAEESVNTTDAAKGTASDLNEVTLTLAAANFAAGDVVGLRIQRDPNNASDTLGAQANVVAVVLEFTGRG